MTRAGTEPLSWTTLGYLQSAGFAGLGDPAAARRPEAETEGRTWIEAGAMVVGIAETDGLPVELGSDSTGPVAARLEFTNDLRDLTSRGEGEWVDVGELQCEVLVAVDVIYATEDRFRIALPLPAGRYRALKYASM